ncbi:MAG: chorismate synthase [Lachnospiraceae bacterium]|nr:chorismate synthase [Lachnospiraceae bacterium]
MKNTFGTSLSVTLFGESHGEKIGVVLDGLAPGIPVDAEAIRDRLSLRRPYGKISTARVEEDAFEIPSGVFEGHTTGTPLCITIQNSAQRSGDYGKDRVIRPGHADYTAQCKYHGYEDYRGGGHFSGRLSAALVAGGAIIGGALKNRGIVIGTHIQNLHGIRDRVFEDLQKDISALNEMRFAVLDPKKASLMEREIENAAERGDSVGGILETAICGIPAGVGEPWFDTAEGLLSHALFSIPAIKGVDFGLGFEGAGLYGSEYNDPLRNENGTVITSTNHNGGINGGITNGMPVIFRCAVKPTPSIFTGQESIDPKTGENVKIKIAGRHDPAIIHRARVVVDSVAAFVVYDLLSGRFGTDFFYDGKS